MGRTISVAVIILFCLRIGGLSVICRYCNLSVPFHGCLLDAGTCSISPGEFCKLEFHEQGGVEWFMVKGCTATKEICHSRRTISNTVHFIYCCNKDMCNI
ncbi:uncharacterized protein C9orf57 homolog [Sarcophilus harrisii]|uniref:UPAR/Ly6 domain-containing protein n=1 Tax=Sarcophilus harrisii TaxID=9305 RepID=A0A7N4P1Y8_SARHA|nr:uncharacterized protein C9orf57 homolog [Sarcophilus harrisii]XP_031799553.1 uncharacterized protein C9orf57 homolog [Sarcophilus harrisii]XP_031799555.1 uncharacterized protein C9orf57 homolog [Sarcophilus harrisii]